MPSFPEDLETSIAKALGQSQWHATRVSGGDIHQAFRLELPDGRRFFCKWNVECHNTMFGTEARGLQWLASSQTIRIPQVVDHGSDSKRSGFLLLEWMNPRQSNNISDQRLGRQLAALHSATPSSFGMDHDNFIGTLPQSNTTHHQWAPFFWQERLLPQIEMASAAGRLPQSIRVRFDQLHAVLADRVGPAEPPARLHGDLWSGNVLVTDNNTPVLIDPAVYGGHREIDLAMMRLFGGFSSHVFGAYAEAFPLAPGSNQRVDLYQIYPLLVHLNLFGTSYLGAVERALNSQL